MKFFSSSPTICVIPMQNENSRVLECHSTKNRYTIRIVAFQFNYVRMRLFCIFFVSDSKSDIVINSFEFIMNFSSSMFNMIFLFPNSSPWYGLNIEFFFFQFDSILPLNQKMALIWVKSSPNHLCKLSEDMLGKQFFERQMNNQYQMK